MAGSAKRDARKADIAERQRKALELRKAGATYESIGRALKCDRSAARRDVQDAIATIVAEPAAEVLTLEMERLDALWLTLYGKARGGDINAARVALTIMDRRAKYLGLDKVANSNEPPLDPRVTAWLDALEAEKERIK